MIIGVIILFRTSRGTFRHLNANEPSVATVSNPSLEERKRVLLDNSLKCQRWITRLYITAYTQVKNKEFPEKFIHPFLRFLGGSAVILSLI